LLQERKGMPLRSSPLNHSEYAKDTNINQSTQLLITLCDPPRISAQRSSPSCFKLSSSATQRYAPTRELARHTIHIRHDPSNLGRNHTDMSESYSNDKDDSHNRHVTNANTLRVFAPVYTLTKKGVCLIYEPPPHLCTSILF
jgi:hypothetical protein